MAAPVTLGTSIRIFLADGFVVYAGALARSVDTPSIHAFGAQLRIALREKGLFVEAGDQLRLTEDYLFTSPSSAAMAMLGRNANGRVEWKNADGRTLKALQIAGSGDDL